MVMRKHKHKALKNKLFHQYDKFSAEYASLAEIDPAKKFIQYPEALRLLGDVKNKKILDIGCGNGIFTRMLARRGASVVGYDPSIKQIEVAQKLEQQEKLGIRYFVADRPPILPEYKFDEAVSVMVLLYATDQKNLREIFSYAHKALVGNGSFSSIIFYPVFKRFGEIVYNRRFSKTDDGKIQVEFIDECGKVKMKARFSNFSIGDYERAAKEAGFTKIEWVKLTIASEGKDTKGSNFWQNFENDPPYIGIKVSKHLL